MAGSFLFPIATITLFYTQLGGGWGLLLSNQMLIFSESRCIWEAFSKATLRNSFDRFYEKINKNRGFQAYLLLNAVPYSLILGYNDKKEKAKRDEEEKRFKKHVLEQLHSLNARVGTREARERADDEKKGGWHENKDLIWCVWAQKVDENIKQQVNLQVGSLHDRLADLEAWRAHKTLQEAWLMAMRMNVPSFKKPLSQAAIIDPVLRRFQESEPDQS